ncbi:hypothetical protein N336_03296, partial [Phalacrocorax carbo]
IDVKVMFFVVPLRDEDKAQFVFTWKRIKYTFSRLPQEYKHSPAVVHNVLAKILAEISHRDSPVMCQYRGDILRAGDNQQTVERGMEKIVDKLTSLGLEIPTPKRQGPGQGVKFLGVWWIKGAVSTPPDSLQESEEGRTPESEVLGTLGYWRKHIPGFSIIARPPYNLLQKGVRWEWDHSHDQASQTSVAELRLFQQLGPVHPHDP